jgi:hypothetical protein
VVLFGGPFALSDHQYRELKDESLEPIIIYQARNHDVDFKLQHALEASLYRKWVSFDPLFVDLE